ncbi:MAG: 23S rRNA (pseudouridine(1915)-N(3))-methyltransferase RlmH [Bacteroidales bacterium]
MKIELLTIGKTDSSWVREGMAQYLGRLRHYTDLQVTELPDIKNAGKMRQEQVKILEGELILKRVEVTDLLILLDENGKAGSSEDFAALIQSLGNQSVKKVVFVIGGAWGFSEAVYARAGRKMALSAMTFNHELVRVIFLEQLYRAFTIIRGEPYHHR